MNKKKKVTATEARPVSLLFLFVLGALIVQL